MEDDKIKEVAEATFTHLHVHTEYSLLDGMCRTTALIKKAKELGMKALAITDHGVCYGWVKFYNECKEAGIKPILGCECYEAPGDRRDKSKDTSAERYYHLVLLVKNEIGYKNLCYLVTRSNTEGMHYKPRIDLELLQDHHEGLICLSACLAGRIPKDILKGDVQKTIEDVLRYKEMFGDDYYLEIQNHGIPEEMTVAHELVRISREYGIKLVCTNDCHYINSEDAEAHEWLLCSQTQKTITDPSRMIYTGDYSFKSEQEMRSLFPSLPDAFDNTMEIAEKCNFEFKFAKKPEDYRMPKVILPKEYGNDYFRYLRDETWKGYEKRYPEGHPYRKQAKPRLEYELSVIKNMGFAEYFLDTRKTIFWSRKNNILVGPGRGSGAGSCLNYCLGITDLEPLRYNLLFERFLNPERISMPDIDVDYQYDKKAEVIQSEADSNGREKFCKIQTLGSMFAKSIIRSTCRVAGFSPAVGNRLAKMIPNEQKVTLGIAYETNAEIAEYLDSTPGLRKAWEIAEKLEGLKKSAGTHACGHIPTPIPCEELFPCSMDKKTGYLVCQYDMVEAEHLGNLKKDLLMLRNLTVIKVAHQAIKEHFDIDVPLWTEEILNDEKALRLFWTGDTNGVFQFESEGMKDFMRKLKPDCFEDIIAGVSLYRPGPMDYIPKYVEGKHNPASITYDCPELEPILEPTYGVIVYQEQVMAIVRILAGFSMGRADLIRKAMGKKKQDIIDAERSNFVYGNEELGIDGCIKRGISEKVAHKIYDDMAEFAKYAFNKSHAACYAAISMQTAYLKAHYPSEFMAGLLTSVMDVTKKLAVYIKECKEIGVVINKPDINSSSTIFTSNQDGSLTYGLSSIKAVGEKVVNAIINERETNGRFTGIFDIVRRVPEVNKATLIAFAKAGALDSFNITRRTLVDNMAEMVSGTRKEARSQVEGQISLFDLVPEEMSVVSEVPVLPEFSRRELLANEKAVTGLYLSGHPFDIYNGIAKNTCALVEFDTEEADDNDSSENLADIPETEDEVSAPKKYSKWAENDKVTVAGIVTSVKKTFTKKDNSPMMIFTIEDTTSTCKVICFPTYFAEFGKEIVEDAALLIKGTVLEEDDGTYSIAAKNIVSFDKAIKKLYVRLCNNKDAVEQLAIDCPGNDVMQTYDGSYHTLPIKVNAILLAEQLRKITDYSNVVIRM